MANHPSSLVDLFQRQVRKTPDAVVVVTDDGESITLGELDKVTDALAVHFVQKYNSKRGSAVAIYMGKCMEYVVSYIAALKAGGAYLPVDISYPKQLLEVVVEESSPSIICTKPCFAQNLSGCDAPAFVFTDDWREKLKNDIDKSVLPDIGLDDMAYIVYSSGTTGRPKGIQCAHRGAVLSYLWRFENYPFLPDDRVACNVFFVWELLRPILQGIPMYIVPDDVIYDPPSFCSFIERHGITRILFTPSLLEAILDTQPADYIAKSFESFRIIWLCGEVVTVALLERITSTLPFVSVINLYSVSECHDVATCDLSQWWTNAQKKNFDKSTRKYAPVGRVLPGVKVAILDEDSLSKQPIGMSGEIFVGGPTLAIGYLNRPEINAKRFITCTPALEEEFGNRLYKTGDWGYLLSDGSLEICGRCDTLVKIRGYSIEIQAIESMLLQVPAVLNCAVVSHGKEGEDKQLAAYVILKDQKICKKELRATLKRRLPFYMIPSYFVVMDCLPLLTSSSKVDKKALPPVDPTKDIAEADALPQTDTERRLAAIWSEVLNLKSIDIQESFFDLGGHSLLAARLLKKVQDIFGVQLSVRDLFAHPTVSVFAHLLEGKSSHSLVKGTRLDLLEEVDKHDLKDVVMDLDLRAFWRSMRWQWQDRFSRGCVLLTGATGYVGTYMLRDLLRLTAVRIVCLVRETADESVEQRLRTSFKKFGLLDDVTEKAMQDRVSVMKGDVTLIKLGLSDDDYHFLSFEIDFVIHSAAYVNLVYPYEALHGSNVLGTQNVLLFCYANKVKPLHYVSTDGVIPSGKTQFPETTEMDDVANDLSDGYGQSKWVAEQLVVRAEKRGLPVVIYRIGNQAGDSEGGLWNPQDFIYLFLYGCCTTGAVPKLDWMVEMTPVNFTTKFIVTLATQRFKSDVGKVFHLCNNQTTNWAAISLWMRAFGYGLQQVPYAEWIRRIETALSLNESNPSLRLLDRLLDTWAPDETFFSEYSTYRRDNTDGLLNELGWKYPRVDETLLKRWLKQLVANGQLPKPPMSRVKHLEGKVCIVTGASSGIGEAIAYRLAVEGGAKVAVVARSIDKLENLCARIRENDAYAMAVKCDVQIHEQVRDMVTKVRQQFGAVDVLINNAGVMYYTMMHKCQEEQWQHQIDINCKGTMNCIGAVLQAMVERKSGHIVNITSDAGKRGFAGLAVYSGTKFFLEGMASALRQEMVEFGIKVTNIQPGDVSTELASRSTDTEARNKFDGTLGTHKVLEPEDVASAVLYALSRPPHVAVNELLIEPTAAPI